MEAINATAAVQQQEVTITRVPFARGFMVINDLETARRILATEDDYVRGLSVFDRQAKTQSDDREVTAEEFMAFQASQVIPFDQSDVEKLVVVIKEISTKLEAYPRLPSLVPETIYLSLTTGLEEGRAAYCRGLNGIFLPRNMIKWDAGQPLPMPKLIAHELWHVISRNLEKTKRDEVYSCIGFKPFNAPFEYPSVLLPRKISNPDGPKFEHFIEFTSDDGDQIAAIPLIFSRHPRYDKKVAPIFFQYLVVAMLVVEKNDAGVWVPAQNPDSEPGEQPSIADLRLLNIGDMPESFWSQVGRNTSYFFHPDETTADNFVILVHKQPAESPHVLENLAAVFGGEYSVHKRQ